MFGGVLVSVLLAILSSLVFLSESPIEAEVLVFPSLPELPSCETQLGSRVSIVPGITGPESFAVDSQGKLYTGLADGRIIRTSNAGNLDSFEEFARTGAVHERCGDGSEVELECGRPLGLEFDWNGDLIVADAAKGLLRIFKHSRKQQVLVPSEETMFPNSIAIDHEQRIIYFTDSSARFRRFNVLYELLEGRASGSLKAYNESRKMTRTLISNLVFPNGLAFDNSHSSLLITSTSKSTLYKYDIRQGKLNTLHNNLPGFPDNISYNKKNNTFWIGMSNKRSKPFSLFHTLAGLPRIRNTLAKIIPKQLIQRLQPAMGMVIEIDDQGKILSMLCDTQYPPRVSFISEAFEYQNLLLFGSFHSSFLAFIDFPI